MTVPLVPSPALMDSIPLSRSLLVCAHQVSSGLSSSFSVLLFPYLTLPVGKVHYLPRGKEVLWS